MKNIILIGMPGTGKSVVGRALAERLRCSFVDADDRLLPGLYARFQKGEH